VGIAITIARYPFTTRNSPTQGPASNSVSSLAHEAFEANESTNRVIRVNSSNSGGMTGIPDLQHDVCLLADGDSRGFQPHAGTQAVEQARPLAI